jgi:23S rRNA (cytidine1920-2'-O)/16S rRNA (cytidine1409-2'-O)-methyltransferase
MVDIGSSTGGFTDCALQNNIKKVIAIDVGSNQLDSSLIDNDKVILYENTDFRDIDINILNDVDIATIDVSFISVTKITSKLKEIESLKEIICLIKPQFEVGKEISHKYKGIVLNRDIHIKVIKEVIDSFSKINFNCKGIIYSPITGGDGNIEYLVYLNKDNLLIEYNINNIVNDAFNILLK